ncbi:MAG: rhamnogalacturonan acetylesterase [Candidatus Didemnitutus sp.]|nr:rhamnogalacturonan acetylesterase [Candidatus Didemnitutus sp.]
MKLPALALLAMSSLVLASAQTPPPAGLPDAPPENPGKIDPALPTIFVAGDSTAARAKAPQQGWAVEFAKYLDLSKVNVSNRALGGRSSRTFITQGWWAKLLADVKPGDWVLIQFGHNDSSPVNEDAATPREKMRSRGSLPGLGEETQDIVNVLTGKPETVRTFGSYLREMIRDVRAKGATPILLSRTIRCQWPDGKIERGAPHRDWTRELAQAEGVWFVDVSRLVADAFQKLGEEKVKTFFPADHTHTNVTGADAVAQQVVAGLLGLKAKEANFARWLAPAGAAIQPDPIGWLNLPEPRDPKLPTLLLIGDSTVRNGRGDGAGGQWGWGEPLATHFDPSKINVVNRAIGGLSSRTFLTQGHWERALTLLKRGDVVLMQFGHNDNGPLNDTTRARGTIKGVGEETETIDNQFTHTRETVGTYGSYLRRYIRDAKAAGATPIICTLVPRKTWKDGKIVRSNDSYAAWAREVARHEGVRCIDLNELVATRYDELGQAAVDALFADEHTHTSRAGAELNASIVAHALAGFVASDASLAAFRSEN